MNGHPRMILRHDWTLRAAVIGWLRYDRHCNLVCYERSPLGDYYYRPDIIGVDKNRRVIEVELKRSMADFRANAKKIGLTTYADYHRPYQFYFAVTRDIAEAVLRELPDGAGLLTLSKNGTRFGPSVNCLRGAKINRESPRLTVKQMVVMVAHQTGSLHRAAVALSQASKPKDTV